MPTKTAIAGGPWAAKAVLRQQMSRKTGAVGGQFTAPVAVLYIN